MRWVRHVAHIGEIRNTKVLVTEGAGRDLHIDERIMLQFIYIVIFWSTISIL
jgi:hypothetical protein